MVGVIYFSTVFLFTLKVDEMCLEICDFSEFKWKMVVDLCRLVCQTHPKVVCLTFLHVKQSHVLASLKLPDTVLSVYDLVSSSDLNKRIYFFKRVRDGFKIFRALRAPALS